MDVRRKTRRESQEDRVLIIMYDVTASPLHFKTGRLELFWVSSSTIGEKNEVLSDCKSLISVPSRCVSVRTRWV